MNDLLSTNNVSFQQRQTRSGVFTSTYNVKFNDQTSDFTAKQQLYCRVSLRSYVPVESGRIFVLARHGLHHVELQGRQIDQRRSRLVNLNFRKNF